MHGVDLVMEGWIASLKGQEKEVLMATMTSTMSMQVMITLTLRRTVRSLLNPDTHILPMRLPVVVGMAMVVTVMGQ